MSNPVSIIAKKRDGEQLSPAEIAEFIDGYATDAVPDYQMSALAMAIFLNGMEPAEIACLTRAMLNSGTILQWPAGGAPKVDKHSTGGIGDKVSLILAPMLACCGMEVPMISGRGLGPSGGTLDKLEAIPGFRCDLPLDTMQQISQDVGCVINGATAELAPADKKLYALRDVTATVPSIPLITGSIMSKKLAEGLDALVLDVKCGSGAFMKTREQATALAHSLVNVGKEMNLKISAILTDMSQPLGRMVGNTVEVDESIAALAGDGPKDLIDCTLELCAETMCLAGLSATRDEAKVPLQASIDSGAALEKFYEMIAAQGGDAKAHRPVADACDVNAEQAGCVSRVDAEQLGWAIIEMGGGRRVKTDQLDHSVGFEMLVRVGDSVAKGQPLVKLFAPEAKREPATQMIRDAIELSDKRVVAPELILDSIG
jgi:pyrimidine-nucleoside phosphorylase